jgi:7-cyano-7-deazaguanine synthase
MNQGTVLFSGGIDSTTVLYWALSRYNKVYPLTFDYGQRHKVEIRLAQELTRKLNISHKMIKMDLSQIGGSSLTDPSLPLPEFQSTEDIQEGPPLTYVPFRNGILLSLAAAWAEVKGVNEIICGFNVIDSPNYPDTRKPFVEAMEEAISQGTKALYEGKRTKIIAPFLDKKKSEIIKMGIDLGADYSYSISCYSGNEIPCLKCSSCLLRQKAWEEAGLKDHLIIRLEQEGLL